MTPFILTGCHEAAPALSNDWTKVDRSSSNRDWWGNREWGKFKVELQARDVRNQIILEKLKAGRPVWYTSTGDSMWPLVHSGDGCGFHPVVTAATATDFIPVTEIRRGDIVFCEVQPSEQLFAHIVLRVEWDQSRYKYWIGNIEQR